MFERIRSDATALVVLIALGVLGLVPSNELFDGFSGNAVISIIATMILGAGLDHTGALHRLASWLLRRSRGMEDRLILLDVGGGRTDVRLHAEPVRDRPVPAGGLAPVGAHRRGPFAPAVADGGRDRHGRRPDHGRQLAVAHAQRPGAVGEPQPAQRRGFARALPDVPAAADRHRAADRRAAVLPLSRQEMAARRRGRPGPGDARAHRELLRAGLRHRRRSGGTHGRRREPAGRHVDRRGGGAEGCAAVPRAADRQRGAAVAAGRPDDLGRQRDRRDGRARGGAGLRAGQPVEGLDPPAQLRRPVRPQPRRHFRGGDPADLAVHRPQPGRAAVAQALRHQPAGDQPREEGVPCRHPPVAAA